MVTDSFKSAAKPGMNIRNQARALLIQTAARLRVDELALRIQSRTRSSMCVVVAVHETPRSMAAQFQEQLEWVSKHFTIANLESFAGLWENGCQEKSKQNSSRKPLILFTFDDGRESNYTVAAPLLEAFGGRGVFFIVPAFAECEKDGALAFYRSRINPDSRIGDEQWEDWKPMNPQQIETLASRGHAIGNHTLTHERLVGLSDERLEREIGDGARKLSAWTHKPVDAFAWTFGWDAIDANAWNVIQFYHRFCFVPCAGAIDSRKDSLSLLWRREIEVRYAPEEYRFLYSGVGDMCWKSRRNHLRQALRIARTDTR
jgi:peptidoglycan/xylan/chitin deacetylase (PgdA/CDA1 family)